MKIIKIKKEHKKMLKGITDTSDGIINTLEVLSERLLQRKKLLWEIIRKEYPEVKKDIFASYDKEKQQISLYENRLEYLKLKEE